MISSRTLNPAINKNKNKNKNGSIYNALSKRETTSNRRFGNKDVKQEFIAKSKFTIDRMDNTLIFYNLNEDFFDQNLTGMPIIEFKINTKLNPNITVDVKTYILKNLEHINGYKNDTIVINGRDIESLISYKIYGDGKTEYIDEFYNDDTVISSLYKKYLFTNLEKNVLYFFPDFTTDGNMPIINEYLKQTFGVAKVYYDMSEIVEPVSSRGGGKRILKKYK